MTKMTRFEFCITLAVGQISVAIGFLTNRKPDSDPNKEAKRQVWIKALKAAAAALNEIIQNETRF